MTHLARRPGRGRATFVLPLLQLFGGTSGLYCVSIIAPRHGPAKVQQAAPFPLTILSGCLADQEAFRLAFSIHKT